MIDGGGWMVEDGRGTICIAFQAKRECCGSHTPGLHPRPRDFIPGYLRSARGVFQTLLSNNSGPFQHRDAEASEILLSGFSVPLWLYPWTSSQDTHASVAEGDTSSLDDRHRL